MLQVFELSQQFDDLPPQQPDEDELQLLDEPQQPDELLPQQLLLELPENRALVLQSLQLTFFP